MVKDGPPRDSSVLLLGLFLFSLQASSPLLVLSARLQPWMVDLG